MKDLLEHGENFYKKNQDYYCHHSKHDQGIGNCTSNLFGNFLFLFIVQSQAVQNFVQASCFFTGFYIGGHSFWKTAGILKSLGKRTVFFHGIDKWLQNLTICVGFAFFTEDMESFCC